MAKWKNNYSDLRYDDEELDFITKDSLDYKIKEMEVALKHPINESIVKIDEDGSINIFVDEEVGIRLDKENKSIALFGRSIQMITNQMDFLTKPYGFGWNGKIFNPALYNKGEKDIMMEKIKETEFSRTTKDMMKKLGIEVE